MRIEAVAQQNAVVQIQEKSVRLQQGDVVSATVVSRDGDGAVLQCEDGRTLRARLAGADLHANDRVELMVSGAGQEGTELRVVFVEPGAARVSVAPAAAQGALMQAFADMGCKSDAARLAQAAAMLRDFPVDETTAAFFTANDIEPTVQNVAAFSALAGGSRLGETLFGLAQQFLAAQGDAALAAQPGAVTGYTSASEQDASASRMGFAPTAPPNGAQAVPGGGAALSEQNFTAAQQAAPLPAASKAPLGPDGRQTASATIVQASQERTTSLQTTGTQNSPRPPQGRSVLSEVPTEGANRDAAATPLERNTGVAPGVPTGAPEGDTTAAQPQVAPQADEPASSTQAQTHAAAAGEASPQKEGGVTNAPVQTSSEEEAPAAIREQAEGKPIAAARRPRTLAQEFLAAFAEGETLDAGSLKKAARETPQKLALLQKMVENTDDGAQKPAAESLKELAAQTKLVSDISRFICLQVPVHQKGYGTAEVYVYKRNRRGAQLDPENACIALGISTENLGRVEALIRVENRSVFIGMHVENEAAVGDIGVKTAELYKALGRMHYALCECRVSPLAEPVTVANAEQALRTLATRAPASIDLKI